MKVSLRHSLIGYGLALVGVASVTAFYRGGFAGVNATTVALSFLLLVLVISSARGLAAGIVASVAGMLCLNFFFLPPTGTFTVEDPQNWTALFAFLITAVITSQLSAMVRARAREAEQRRQELLILYRLSQAIILNPDPDNAMSTLAREVVHELAADSCVILTRQESGGWEELGAATKRHGYPALRPPLTLMEDCFQRGEMEMTTANGRGEEAGQKILACAPLKVGVKPTGVLALLSSSLERGIVEAVAGLVSLALERTRFLQDVSRTEALRQSDELKAALLASVSHDLRTPLTSIRAAVDSLLQSGMEWDKEMTREFHLIISEEVQRLTKLVQNLLEMARIEAGELHLEKRWTAVPELIATVVERCREAARDHTIRVEVEEGLPLANVDSLLVSEALSHLVENAAKYSPAGGDVTIRGQIKNHDLLLSVEDRGPGIAAEEIERIFDKFYRAAASRQSRRSGTGMGLSIARGIIEAHGGRIWAESKVGLGSVFSLAIPIEVRSSDDTRLRLEQEKVVEKSV